MPLLPVACSPPLAVARDSAPTHISTPEGAQFPKCSGPLLVMACAWTGTGGSEMTITKLTRLKSKYTSLPPYTKIALSSSPASWDSSYHSLHWTQRQRHDLGLDTVSQQSAGSLLQHATLFLTSSNFSEALDLSLPLEEIEPPPLQAGVYHLLWDQAMGER